MNKRDKALELRQKCLDMIAVCKKECREFTDEEQAQFDETKNELIALSEEIKAVDDKVEAVAESVPEVPAEAPAESTAEENPDDSEEVEDKSCAPDDKEKKSSDEEEINNEEAPAEEAPAEEKPSDNGEETAPAEEEKPAEEVPAEEAPADEPKDDKNKRSIDNKIMKDFSILRAIRSVANNTKMDDFDQAVINAGAEEFRKNGLQTTGQIQIPGESRAVHTVSAEHDDIIETDFQSILTPLYAKTALVESGAQVLTGLVSEIQIPIMNSKNNVGWETEIDDAMQTNNTFTHKKMSPHRITAFLDISKQLLAQDSIGVETAIRQDLLNALTDKLESTFLGNGNGSITKGEGESAVTTQNVAPKGILNGKTATSVANYAGLCDFEASLECADIYAPARYILSPKAKAALRSMNYGGKTTGMVMDTPNSVDGTPAVSTTHMGASGKYFLYGDFSQVVIGQWSGLDLTIDTITQATKGCVRVVINAYYDMIVKRPEAILYGQITA